MLLQTKRRQNSDEEELIIQIIKSLPQPIKTLDIAKKLGFTTKKQINPTLYKMQRRGLLSLYRQEPPMWCLNNQDQYGPYPPVYNPLFNQQPGTFFNNQQAEEFFQPNVFSETMPGRQLNQPYPNQIRNRPEFNSQPPASYFPSNGAYAPPYEPTGFPHHQRRHPSPHSSNRSSGQGRGQFMGRVRGMRNSVERNHRPINSQDKRPGPSINHEAPGAYPFRQVI